MSVSKGTGGNQLAVSFFSMNSKNEAGEPVNIMAWMYILKCKDGTYYTGSTTNLELRVAEHQQGLGARYTAKRRPVELVYACEFQSTVEAYEREDQVKDWNRAKKEALIRGDFEALPELARKKEKPKKGNIVRQGLPSSR